MCYLGIDFKPLRFMNRIPGMLDIAVQKVGWIDHGDRVGYLIVVEKLSTSEIHNLTCRDTQTQRI